MQTFLPSSDFDYTARVLDRQRLGKQRVETHQILSTLLGLSDGWANHPAVRMWNGYETALLNYGLVICDEWISRGYTDNMKTKLRSLFLDNIREFGLEQPPWLGDQDFHNSHKAALLAKDPEHYEQFGWDVSPEIEYVWPVSDTVSTNQ